jgi:hypothetical protein
MATNVGRIVNGTGSSRHSTLLLLIAILPTIAAAMDSEFSPPTATFFVADFTDATSIPENWQVDAGSWAAYAGTYKGTSAVATATTTMPEYVINPIDMPAPGMNPPYTYRARLLNQRAGAGDLAGIVFDYLDAANYDEVVFAPTGTFVARRVRDGTSRVLAQSTYPGGGQNVWVDVELRRLSGFAELRAGGKVVAQLSDMQPNGGRLGLTTHNTRARFDQVSIAVPFDAQPFREAFGSGLPSNWSTIGGEWSVGPGGTLDNTSLQQTSSVLPNGVYIDVMSGGSVQSYTLRARMLNPYRGSGNLVGMFFNDSSVGRAEVVFSPTGVARINLIRNGVSETIATASYSGGGRNVWFDVRTDVDSSVVTVAVNGVTVFDTIPLAEIFQGVGGLVTHWAPGRFDDVWYDDRGTFHPLTETFDAPTPASWDVSGIWIVGGGRLINFSAGATDIVATACACWETDFSYRARLLNQYGASGNLVGAVYNYQRHGLYTGDYYEVVFSPTGLAFLNKVLNGMRQRVATGTHSVPRNVWFDVEVLRQGLNTTVKVNGATVFNKVPQSELSFGDVGVVIHWAKAWFDNLSVADAPPR